MSGVVLSGALPHPEASEQHLSDAPGIEYFAVA